LLSFIVQSDGKRAQFIFGDEAPIDEENVHETRRKSLVTFPGEPAKRAKYMDTENGDSELLVPRDLESGAATHGSIFYAIHDPEAELSNTYGCTKVTGGFIEQPRASTLRGTHQFAPNMRDSQFEQFFSSLSLTV